MRVHEHCTVQHDGRLTIVTINRPTVLNALHGAAHQELGNVFDAFAADPDQRVAIITGAGDRAFCAGNDLRAQAAGIPPSFPPSGFGGLTSRRDMDKPIIAAVNGAAMGGGFEIALACDLVVASDTAYFALPEPKVGLAALGGGLDRLPAQIGLKRAMGMILTGRKVSAGEGYELGFVNEVTRPEHLIAVANAWAQAIIDCSPVAIRTSKHIALQAWRRFEALSEHETRHAIQALTQSADFREGPLAFAEKRMPVWQG